MEDKEFLNEGFRERPEGSYGKLGTLLDLALVGEMKNVRVDAGVGVEARESKGGGGFRPGKAGEGSEGGTMDAGLGGLCAAS